MVAKTCRLLQGLVIIEFIVDADILNIWFVSKQVSQLKSSKQVK